MHGFCHIEIPTTDAERSKKFYEDVFGWKFQYDPDSDYWLFETGDGPGGKARLVIRVDDVNRARQALR